MFKMGEAERVRTGAFLRQGKTMPMSKIGNYRYVSHCDGHSQANRLGPLLHSGSIVLLSTEYDVELSASMHRCARSLCSLARRSRCARGVSAAVMRIVSHAETGATSRVVRGKSDARAPRPDAARAGSRTCSRSSRTSPT
jgi:hypothetical protein